jgi:hypothetical protein
MKRIWKFILFFCIVGISAGCMSIAPIGQSQPNLSALYRMPEIKIKLPSFSTDVKSAEEPFSEIVRELFQQLYLLDPVVALEVGKLPEFQGKVGEKQILALSKFVDLVSDITPKQRSNLDAFLKVGKPKVRPYCTPLQAVFWLLEEKEKLLEPSPLDFSLEKVLVYAWVVSSSFDEARWGDLRVVTDRLNAPCLINYYQQTNFMYVSHGECSGSVKSIFSSKKGCCSDYTAFSVYCLKKAGYEAMAIKVVSPTGRAYHVVCEYEDDGKLYIMDNSSFSSTNGKGILEKEIYVRRYYQIGFGYR